ncbi:MAG: hypothetical protein ACFFG0_04305 [Candidatus Thorarchaeota archaeon]
MSIRTSYFKTLSAYLGQHFTGANFIRKTFSRIPHKRIMEYLNLKSSGQVNFTPNNLNAIKITAIGITGILVICGAIKLTQKILNKCFDKKSENSC